MSCAAWITSTPDAACHHFVRRACKAAGFDAHVTMESDDHGVWQGLVAAGVGVALASELSLPSLLPAVVARPLVPNPLRRKIFAAHRVGAAHAPGVAAMLAIIREAVAMREPYAATA